MLYVHAYIEYIYVHMLYVHAYIKYIESTHIHSI